MAYVPEKGKRRVVTGNLCGRAGRGHSDCRHFPGWTGFILCGVFADRVRLGMRQPELSGRAANKEESMSIVVWKSPKALRGILRMLFRVKT